MKKIIPILTFVSLFSPTLLAEKTPTGKKEVWITISENQRKEALTKLRQNFNFVSSRFAPIYTSSNGLSVLKLDIENQNALAGANHSETKMSCPGFVAHSSYKEAVETLGLDFDAIESFQTVQYLENTKPTEDTTLKLMEAVDLEAVKDMNITLENMGSRHVSSKNGSGKGVSNVIKNKWKSLLKNRDDIEFDDSYVGTDGSYTQNSIILKIKGTQAPDEIIVVGGHLDSIVGRGTNRNEPGADDDASGIASITGLISAISKTDFKPKKSIHLIGYAAEEKGLVGSKAIAKAYKEKGKKVVGVLQLDMTGFNEKAPASVIGDFTNNAQNNLLKKLNDRYLDQIGLGKFLDSKCGYGCSDHFSWTKQGYPASFIFETKFGSHNRKIHSRNDKSEHLSFEKMAKFSKLAAAFVVKLSEEAKFSESN